MSIGPTDIGRRHLAEARRILGMPSRIEQWWRARTEAERHTLVQLAGIRVRVATLPWNSLTEQERRAIVATANRVSDWATAILNALHKAPDSPRSPRVPSARNTSGGAPPQ